MLDKINTLQQKIWENQPNFVFELFEFQKESCAVFKKYLQLIQYDQDPKSVHDIPLMPIEFFKNHEIKAGDFQEETIFLSSGTTGVERSRHYIYDLDFYHQVNTRLFTDAFDHPTSFCHLALLPSYLEQGHSSLVAMVNNFIKQSKYSESDFFLYDFEKLFECLMTCKAKSRPTILWGVSYALLDFFELFELDFPELIIIETGGMKGRKKEIVRNELHELFRQKTNARISSEYGMTELLSQAYLGEHKRFSTPQSLRVIGKEINDAFANEIFGKTCRLGIVDFANIHSCSFLLTQDLGRVYQDGSFEVLGRMDMSDLRGCNLMVGD